MAKAQKVPKHEESLKELEEILKERGYSEKAIKEIRKWHP